MKDVFGTYNVRARISVGMIVLAPIIIHAYMLIPTVRELSGTAIIVILFYAFSNILILLARGKGRKALKKCFPDILPAQKWLLPSDSTFDKQIKAQYYELFINRVKGFNVYTDDENMRVQVESAIRWLVSFTRDANAFPLVAEENMNLSFSYNLLGMKPIGFFVNLAMLCLDMLFLHIPRLRNCIQDWKWLIPCLVFSFLFVLVWIFVIRKKMVRDCAENYARALFSACDSLNG